MSEANKKQVGGSHYKSNTIPDHWDVVIALGWDYLLGAGTKYLWRLGKKHPSLEGQLQDLDKAMHYFAKKRELLAAEIEAEHQYELSLSIDSKAAAMGVLGVKKRPLTIGDLVAEIEAEEGGPTAGYVNQDR